MRGKDGCGEPWRRLAARSGVRRALDGGVDVGRRGRQPRDGGRRVGGSARRACARRAARTRRDRRAAARPARSARSAAPRRGAGLRGSPPTRSVRRGPRSRPSGRRSSAHRARRGSRPRRRRSGTATSRKSRGTVRRRRTGAPIELTQAYDGAAGGTAPRCSSRGRPREDQARRAGGRRPAGPRSGRTGRGRPSSARRPARASLPCAVCSVALMTQSRRRPAIAAIESIASRAFACTRARRSSSVSVGRLRRGRDVRLGHAGIGELAPQLLGRIGGRRLGWWRRLDRLGGLATGCLRFASQRPSAARPMRPASEASARFTPRWYREGAARVAMRVLVSYPMSRFLPLHARAIPSSCLPVRPPKTEGRRKGNP